jgi:hypothetical protein
MALEITLPQDTADVQSAMMQFAARRGYRLSHPAHLDGCTIENASLPTPARVEVRVRARDGATVASLSFGENPESIQLAYALQRYLADDKAYTCECPPICPKCSTPVTNIVAKYCGRCGAQLDEGAAIRQEHSTVMEA